MIVSLSLIRLDTVLILERQQMATHESNESIASMLRMIVNCNDRLTSLILRPVCLRPCCVESHDTRASR